MAALACEYIDALKTAVFPLYLIRKKQNSAKNTMKLTMTPN